ncbi:hypothetical protein HDU82_006947 [Entophlyctis luteolus]|nr:hypothetical protein HDU82_006947 [Entophlyctis luteolus]
MQHTSADNEIHGLQMRDPDQPATAAAKSGDTNEPVFSNMPQACIFIGNLDSSKSDMSLFDRIREHFSQWGPINEVKIDRDGANRPFAFIQFKHIADAKRALHEAQGNTVDKRIRVEAANVVCTLRVKYNPSWDRHVVESHFQSFGHVEDFCFLRHRDTNDLKGCVFVKYFSRTDAIKAYVATRKLTKWTVEWAKYNRKFEVDRRSIFVGKLNEQLVTEALLRAKFGKYGEIQTIKLFTQNTSTERPAFAFIQYSSEDDAELAIDELHGSRWLDRIIKVQFREIGQVKTAAPPCQTHTTGNAPQLADGIIPYFQHQVATPQPQLISFLPHFTAVNSAPAILAAYNGGTPIIPNDFFRPVAGASRHFYPLHAGLFQFLPVYHMTPDYL